MAVYQKRTLDYKIDKDFIKSFDEISNCRLVKSYTDTGFLDDNKLSIIPRTPLSFLNTPTSNTGRPSSMYFYTDRNWVTRAYRVINTTSNWTRYYQLQYATVTRTGASNNFGTWTNLQLIPSSVTNANVAFYFDTVNAPISNSGSYISYIASWASTSVDKVVKSASDTAWASAIGKIMLIRDQNYVGTYAYIDWYDSATTTYSLSGSGAIVPFISWAIYYILDRIAPAIRVTSSEWMEEYFDGINYMPHTSSLASDSLQKISVFSSTEKLKRTVFFNNKYFTPKWGTLYGTSWVPWNPFFFTLTSGNTVSNKEITGLYIYKNRIIAYGVDFIYAINSNFVIERLSDSIGVKDNAIYSTGDDLYFISPQKEIISVNELSSGTLFVKNITQKYINYTTDWDEDAFIFSDNRNIYFWASKRLSGSLSITTTMLVYSLEYKYWSTYITPAVCLPSSYNGIVYFTDRFLSWHRAFEQYLFNITYFWLSEVFTITNNVASVSSSTNSNMLQRIATQWNDNWDIFQLKQTWPVRFHLDNVPENTLAASLFMWLDEKISSKAKKIFSITQISSVSVLWVWVTGLEITGGSAIPYNTIIPRLKTADWNIKDSCNAIKLVLESSGSSWFYLARFQQDIFYSPSTNDYQNPNSTN